VRAIAKKVYITHHKSGRTETATGNGVGQAGSRCHCGSHLSVASLIAHVTRYVLRVFCNISYMLLSIEFKSGEFGCHS